MPCSIGLPLKVKSQTCPAISRVIVGFIMTVLGNSYAQLRGTGRMISTSSLICYLPNLLTRFRIRKGLDSGELGVPGEHWPTFVYESYIYDSAQPLLGLFKSAILVSVSIYSQDDPSLS